MGYKVNKIMLGTQQVRPGEIKETYTFNGISGSDTKYYSIAKSGYTVKQIIIEGTAQQLDILAGAYLFISYDTSRTYEGQLSLNIGKNNTGEFKGVRYRTGGSNIDEYGLTNSQVSLTGLNTYKMIFKRTGWELTINGNNLNGTYSSGMSKVINNIMNSTNIQARLATTNATISTQTFTVTYE